MTEFALSWLRPWWLIAYLPLLLCALVWWKSRRGRSDWTQVVDVALQPYVLESEADRSSFSPFALFFTWALVIAMLAGPVWEKTEVPVFEAHPAVVALLDLSPSMRVDDVKPDRLSRANRLSSIVGSRDHASTRESS